MIAVFFKLRKLTVGEDVLNEIQVYRDMDTKLLQYYSKYLVGKVFTALKDHYTISKIDSTKSNNYPIEQYADTWGG